MARKVKRWAVRQEANLKDWYLLFVGHKPRKPKNGWSINQSGWAGHINLLSYEEWFPKHYHLNPGGGPVEIRFEDG